MERNILEEITVEEIEYDEGAIGMAEFLAHASALCAGMAGR
jgi:hypothetical protein